MTGGLPHANVMRGTTAGAVFLLDTSSNAVYDDNSSQYELMTATEFESTLNAATQSEQKRNKLGREAQRKQGLTEPQSYLVTNITQFMPRMPQKAARTLEREQLAGYTEQTINQWSSGSERDYWLERGKLGRTNATSALTGRNNNKKARTASSDNQPTATTQLHGTRVTAKQAAGERRADPAAAVKVTNDHTAKLADPVELEISTRDPDFNISGISKVRGSQGNTAVPENSEISKSGDSQEYTAVPDTTSVNLGNRETAPTTKATTLAALTDTGRKRYLTQTISDATAKERAEFKQSFDEIQKRVLPESEINTPHPEQREMAKSMLQNTRRWKCLREMKETTVMETDEPLVIEDKDGENGAPPNRSYKVPKHLLPQLAEFIQDLLKKKFIEPVPQGKGGNAWYSPILILKKPNGKGYRFVVDLRAVNARTKAIHYYMPDQHELYDRIKHAKYLSMLDARSGYFQAPLAEESRFKCSFKCELGSFRFRVLPMGLTSSAAYFQRWIESKLDRHGVLYRKVSATATGDDVYLDSDGMKCRGFTCIYLDDLVVFSKDANEHQQHLTRLFNVLSDENIYLNTEKCELFCKHIRYLGAIVGSGKLYMCPRKVYSVINMPLPNEGQEQVRMFLGLTGYYRRFISDYAELAGPLMELLKDGVDVKKTWSTAHTDAVNKLKHIVCSYPILRQYDHKRPIVVVSDASDYAIGGALIQSPRRG